MTDKSRKERIQEMLAADPRDAELHYCLGMEFVGEGANEEAARSFRAAIEVGPQYVPAYQQAGQAMVRLGRGDEARELFRRGIAMAQQIGNHHARDEMQGFLAALDE